jgi:hypothetical protein
MYSEFRNKGAVVRVLQSPGNPNPGAVPSNQLVADVGQKITTFVPLRAIASAGAEGGINFKFPQRVAIRQLALP